MNIGFNTKGLDKATNVLSSLTKAFSLEGSGQDIVDNVDKDVSDQFASLGRRGGTPWLPTKDGSGRPPLQNKGTLKNTATHAQFRLVNGGKQIEITFSGPESDLIAIHQFGALIRRQTKKGSRIIVIPARPILALTQKDAQSIAQIALTQILKRLSINLN